MFHDIGAGLRYVGGEPRLRMLVLMFVISCFAMPYTRLLAGFVLKDLGGGDTAFGVLQSFSGMGALVGSRPLLSAEKYSRVQLSTIEGRCHGLRERPNR